jgi:hypothetical protein
MSILISPFKYLKANFNQSFAEILRFLDFEAEINDESLTEFFGVVKTDIRNKGTIYGCQ